MPAAEGSNFGAFLELPQLSSNPEGVTYCYIQVPSNWVPTWRIDACQSSMLNNFWENKTKHVKKKKSVKALIKRQPYKYSRWNLEIHSFCISKKNALEGAELTVAPLAEVTCSCWGRQPSLMSCSTLVTHRLSFTCHCWSPSHEKREGGGGGHF